MKSACPGNCSFPVVYRAMVGAIQSVEASGSESISRNVSEPVSAPLRSGSGQPANDGEASTDCEATGESNNQAARGESGHKVDKEHQGARENGVRVVDGAVDGNV